MKKFNINEEQIIKLLILVIAIIIWFTIKMTVQSPLFEETKSPINQNSSTQNQ